MNLIYWVIRIIILSPVLLLTNCSEENGEKIPDNKDHGGIIAYCYQPAQGDIHQIYLINEDGTGNGKMIESPVGLNHMDWSSDARKVACVGYTDQYFLTWSIYTFNADGSGLTRLTSVDKVWDSDPRWSPNDSLIAFTRINPNKNYKEEIWIMNADGSNQHFSGINGVLGGWSPDGEGFVFSASDGNDYEICTCKIDGSDKQVLTNSSVNEIYASYSPDGSKILYSTCRVNIYTSQNTTSYEIGIMNSDGSGAVQLTTNYSFDGYPGWSPDGNKIIFSSDINMTGKYEIHLMNASGSERKQITNLPAGITGICPAWKPVK